MSRFGSAASKFKNSSLAIPLTIVFMVMFAVRCPGPPDRTDRVFVCMGSGMEDEQETRVSQLWDRDLALPGRRRDRCVF